MAATAFVVVARRDPCTAKLRIWNKWARAVANLAALHFLYDGPAAQLAPAFQSLPQAARPHITTQADERAVQERFAGTRWGGRDGFRGGGRDKLAWLVHFPFVLLWFEAWGERFEYVWTVEHDAFYGGELSGFLRYYAAIDADLVDAFAHADTPKLVAKAARQFSHAANASRGIIGEVSPRVGFAMRAAASGAEHAVEHAMAHVPRDGTVRNRASDGRSGSGGGSSGGGGEGLSEGVSEADGFFGWALPSSLRLMKHEHVERFSRRLLRTMRDLAEVRVSALGEYYESSVCNALSWCVLRDLQADGFVLPKGWAYRGAQFGMCLEDDEPARFGAVWTHKWACTCTSRSNASASDSVVHGPVQNAGLRHVPSRPASARSRARERTEHEA